MPLNKRKVVLIVLALSALVTAFLAVSWGAYTLGYYTGRFEEGISGQARSLVEYKGIWRESKKGPEALQNYLLHRTETALAVVKVTMLMLESDVNSVLQVFVGEGEELLRDLRAAEADEATRR